MWLFGYYEKSCYDHFTFFGVWVYAFYFSSVSILELWVIWQEVYNFIRNYVPIFMILSFDFQQCY